jgi:hypothetical protein
VSKVQQQTRPRAPKDSSALAAMVRLIRSGGRRCDIAGDGRIKQK